jgi:long-chain acyl-CoA synthetase
MPSDVPSMSIAEANAALTAPGQIFEMEERDIRGVPTRTWKNAPANLRVVLDMSLAHGDKTFLVYEDERTTFAEHYRIACTLAHRLQTTFGVEQGDRVAIIMRNLPEWVMAFWAAALTGAIVVPLNAWWSAEELRYGLEDSGSKVVFVDSERAQRIRPVTAGLEALTAVIVADEHRTPTTAPLAVQEPPAGEAYAPEWPFPLAVGDVDEAASPPEVTIDPEDDATIFYTSGTTGRPKGAVGTHRNMGTNLMSLFFINTRGSTRYGTNALAETEPEQATADGATDTATDIESSQPNVSSQPAESNQPAFLLSVPLFHATGCHSVMVTNVAAGGKLVMMHHFDPERALELIERERIATFGGVPAMVMQVLDSPNFSKYDTSSIKGVSYGGAPAPPDLVRRIREAWPVGQPSNGYGLTETSSVTSMNSGADYIAKPESVGPPVPVCDVAVLPEDFAREEPDESVPRGPDVRGELWIKGPNVVRGYWNRPEETAKTFSRGWLHTGDVARLDDEGFIFIVDRAKDMIIRGGENVYSVQVEAALFEHPAVADCAVIGVPDETLGEEVGAVVVLRPGAKVTADELALHVKERLAAFMVPTHIWFRSEPLPRNPQGKVLKRELREELLGNRS